MNPPGWCRVNIFGYIPRPVPRPLPWRHPTGFAGVFHATVLGLVVGWLAVVEVVDAGVVECVGMGVGSGWCPVPWAMCRVVVAPPARRYPTGFAGVSYATNMGLVVRRSARCLLVVVVVVDGVGFVGVRCRGRGCWSRCGSSSCLPVAVVGVDCVFHKSVRCRGRGCWPWCGLSCWPWPLSMGLAFPVFDVVVYSLVEDWVVELACSWSFLVPVGLAFRV